MDIKDLEALKARIEEAKTTKSRAEGAQERILSQWKTEFKVNSLEEAEALLAKMDTDLDRDETRLQGLLDDLEKKVSA